MKYIPSQNVKWSVYGKPESEKENQSEKGISLELETNKLYS